VAATAKSDFTDEDLLYHLETLGLNARHATAPTGCRRRKRMADKRGPVEAVIKVLEDELWDCIDPELFDFGMLAARVIIVYQTTKLETPRMRELRDA
jgi:hypothetical protein